MQSRTMGETLRKGASCALRDENQISLRLRRSPVSLLAVIFSVGGYPVSTNAEFVIPTRGY
jgi:hypothetical protein